MLYHCGVLDEDPDKSRTLNYIRRPNWHGLPPEIDRERQIFMATPGFTVSYIAHVLRRKRDYVKLYLSRYEDWRDEVAANWASATPEDCAALSVMRPGMGDVPLISQIRALEEMKTGEPIADIAARYRVTTSTLGIWRKSGLRFRGPLPAEWQLLVKGGSNSAP